MQDVQTVNSQRDYKAAMLCFGLLATICLSIYGLAEWFEPRHRPDVDLGPDKSMVGMVIRYEWNEEFGYVERVTRMPNGEVYRTEYPSPDE